MICNVAMFSHRNRSHHIIPAAGNCKVFTFHKYLVEDIAQLYFYLELLFKITSCMRQL